MHLLRAKPMTKLLLAMLLMVSPALAQTQIAPKPAPKSATARAIDPCAPIGRTAKGELVYSMKCDTLPVPPPPAQAEAREAPAAPPPEPKGNGAGFSAGLTTGGNEAARPAPAENPEIWLEWSLLPLIPAAMDMVEPCSKSSKEAQERRDR
jgi:hypothetical protein